MELTDAILHRRSVRKFTDYVVTGTEASWVDSLGIPAADVELSTTRATEFTRNYSGIMAVQRWLLGQ